MSGYAKPAYDNEFNVAVHIVSTAVESWAQNSLTGEPFIDGFLDCVFIAKSDGAIALANHAFRDFYANVYRVPGKVDAEWFDHATMGISKKSDELLLSSGRSLEFEHVSLGPAGISYNVRTHKRWLPNNRHNLTILGITRIVSVVERPPLPSSERLANLAKKYEALEPEDQTLCRMLAEGHSQREMAEMLDCTTRTIENRRNRIMEHLEATKPIEIVKLMVRLAEHGMIHVDI